MTTDIRYYIKYPGGRLKIKAKTDDAAMEEFEKHWTAYCYFSCKGERVLVKETRETLVVEPVKKAD